MLYSQKNVATKKFGTFRCIFAIRDDMMWRGLYKSIRIIFLSERVIEIWLFFVFKFNYLEGLL